MNIDKMPAGRLMDILIAEALGKEVCTRQEAIDLTNAAFPERPPWDSWYARTAYIKEALISSTGLAAVPDFSMLDSEAIELLTLLSMRGWEWELKRRRFDPLTQCLLTHRTLRLSPVHTLQGWGNTISHAICRAAYKALTAAPANQA